jgi:hypothetical protein
MRFLTRLSFARGKGLLFALVILCISGSLVLQAEPKTPTFHVLRPTILAFFPRTSEAELAKDPDLNETLSDFQLYAGQVRQPLQARGIDFREVYSRSFSVRVGGRITYFTPGKVQVGYYLIAPGKKPLIRYGVMTDDDLLQVADRYFGTTGK